MGMRSYLFFCVPFPLLLVLSPMASASTPMRFASPLQALTIWDNSEPVLSPRDLYLQQLKAGLEAEKKVREELKKKHDAFLSKQDTASPDWAEKAVRYERVRKAREDRLVAKAYDEAVKRVITNQQKELESASPTRNKNKFQFVGVISQKDNNHPVTWYARKRPENAEWSLRLVHVNRGAIIKDLFDRGKVDIFSKYKNDGIKAAETPDDATNVDTPKGLVVTAHYEARERSWRTLWNFSPKHFFTDSSGMYWRERRLPSGVYTDGTSVFETTYRYKDGRNGIRKVRTLDQFLQDASVDQTTKDKLLKRIQTDPPDIVVE